MVAGPAGEVGGLAERDTLHRALVASSPYPIYLVDARDLRLVEANPALSDLVGYAPSDLIGMPLGRLDPRPEADLRALAARVVAQAHLTLGESELLCADGSRVPVEGSATLVAHGGAPVVSVFARDIRERRRAEEEQRRLERQLWHSQKHEAVGRLAGGIAHDFNNIVMAIILNADMIREHLGPDHPLQDDLEEIQRAGRRASDLTRQLLAFSGRQVLRPHDVQINDVVRGVERLLRRTIGEDIELVVDLQEGLGLVHVDAGQMEQVILNLVVNARDAMPAGGTVAMSTGNVEIDEAFARDYMSIAPGAHVVLAVSDTGSGMDADTQARIFEPFFTTKMQGKGTGLGLATAYGIVKQSRGSIWVTSRPGFGSTFRVYLPEVRGGGVMVENPRREREAAVVGGTESVMIVEDDASVRRLMGSILRGLGYGVVDAARPAEALRLYRQMAHEGSPPALVVSDVVMPEMSGPQMVRELRRGGDAVRVLFVSGYAAALQDLPEEAFLAKPFSREALAASVRRALAVET